MIDFQGEKFPQIWNHVTGDFDICKKTTAEDTMVGLCEHFKGGRRTASTNSGWKCKAAEHQGRK